VNKLIIIAAAAENNALGINNDLPWHLPDDFKRFKKLTTGHKIIMGRKTFESFPKPLPNRVHIIITRDTNYRVDFPDCIVVHSLEEALKLAEGEDSFIIGGGEIYKQAMPLIDRLEVTRVHAIFDEADTFFPEINSFTWKEVKRTRHEADEKHPHAFSFVTYLRK